MIEPICCLLDNDLLIEDVMILLGNILLDKPKKISLLTEHPNFLEKVLKKNYCNTNDNEISSWFINLLVQVKNLNND